MLSDKQRADQRTKGQYHCCPICCTAASKQLGRNAKHAPLWLDENEQWYCPRDHEEINDD